MTCLKGIKALDETIIRLYLWTSCNEGDKGAKDEWGNERPLLMMAIAFCTGI